MWFDSWRSIGQTLLIAALVYPLLIVILRLGGKRTLAQMNAFDFIINVALGSLVATTLVETTKLADGIVAIAALVALQGLITWLSVRSDRFEGVVKSQPTLVFHDGQYLEGPMREERVTREEVRGAIRKTGRAEVGGVTAVVLESDGTFSVLQDVPTTGAHAMAGVDGVAGRWDTGPAQGPFSDPERGPLSEVGTP